MTKVFEQVRDGITGGAAIIAASCLAIEKSQYSGVRDAGKALPPPPWEEPVLNRKLRRPIVGLAACVLVGTTLGASPASAAPAAGLDPSFAPSALATKLDAKFGTSTAGSYIDAAGKVV